MSRCWRMYALVEILLAMLMSAPVWAEDRQERWIAYYHGELPAESFRDYDLIAFDREHHPPLDPLRGQGRVVLGYVSLGEAEVYRSDYEYLREAGLLVSENRLWKGHWIVDIRKPEWIEHITDVVVPQVIAEGFDGIVLDTIDSPLELEANNPARFSGMRDAAVNALRILRARYPDLVIMLNRGFEILPAVANYIDLILAENLYTGVQPGGVSRKLTSKAEYARSLRRIRAALEKAPHLKVYTLDYWPESDVAGVKRIYREMRVQGFIPYVGAIELDTIQSEP